MKFRIAIIPEIRHWMRPPDLLEFQWTCRTSPESGDSGTSVQLELPFGHWPCADQRVFPDEIWEDYYQ